MMMMINTQNNATPETHDKRPDQLKIGRKDWVIGSILSIVIFSVLFVDLMAPGVTWDEAFVNFDIVKRQAAWFSGLTTLEDPFSNETITEYWFTTSDHPSLFRSISAFSYLLFSPMMDEIRAIRLPSTIFFALLCGSVFLFLRQWLVRSAALAGALSLILMPRVFGHAHFFSLDVPIMCMWFWTACIAYLCVLGKTKPWVFGMMYGLAFSTKLHAVFLPFPLLCWALLYILFVSEQKNALLIRCLWMVFWAALFTPILYFGTQPYLWHDSIDRFIHRFFEYATKTPIHVFYLGERYGQNTPWHYPLVMTVLTVPVSLLLYAMLSFGTLFNWKLFSNDQKLGYCQFLFVLLHFITPLMIILLPLAQGYDGTRLFLPAFPFLACLVGVGFGWILNMIQNHLQPRLTLILLYCILIIPPLITYTTVRPFYLAYYNELAGGVRGAKELGMETTFWADSLTRDFLSTINDTIPSNGTLRTYALPYELIEYYKHRGLLRDDIGFPAHPGEGYHLIQFRQGFFVQPEWYITRTQRPLAMVEVNGVPLMALYGPIQNN